MNDPLPVTIERARPEDAEAICDIRDRAWLKAYPNAELGITEEDVRIAAQGRDGEFVPRRIVYLQKHLAEQPDNELVILVAKQDGKVVGYVEPAVYDGRRFIGAIYVDPDYQGAGVGGKLLKAALDHFGREQDIFLEVVSYNRNAIGFYEHFGFEKTDAVVAGDPYRPDYLVSFPEIEMVLRHE